MTQNKNISKLLFSIKKNRFTLSTLSKSPDSILNSKIACSKNLHPQDNATGNALSQVLYILLNEAKY